MSRSLPETVIYTPQQAGAYLRDRRRALKLTQAQVATRLGVSQNRFSVLETGAEDLSLERLLVLAKTLGLELVLRTPDSAAEGSPTGRW